MAKLSVDQIKEVLQQTPQKISIAKAVRHEERLRFHCENVDDKDEISSYFQDFKKWVQSFLPADKFDKFEKLICPPLPTVEFTESIFSELQKVFDAQDRFIKVDFKNPDFDADFMQFRQKLDENTFWREEAFEAAKTAINSVLIVDLPQQQQDTRPEPYFYLLDIRNVIAIDNTKKGVCEYIVFKDGSRFAAFDEEFYRIFEQKEQGGEYVLLTETKHGLGFTPARMLWKTKLNKKDFIRRRGPISNSLSELDWLLFFMTSKKYLDLYAPYPIYSGYEQRCGYKTEQGERCEDGFIIHGENSKSACPKCGGKGKLQIGVGSYIEIPPPTDREDADLRNPVQVLPAEITSLDYCVAEIDRRKESIFLSCVGMDGEPKNDQAKNEKQVASSFESKANVLNKVKTNFEEIHRFALETVAALRYGRESVTKVTVNYGAKFYLQSVEELNKDYADSRNSGKSNFELALKRDAIFQTQYKNNPDELLRVRILSDLEPLQGLTPEQVVSRYSAATISDIDFFLKENFNTFIRQFERENGSVVSFMQFADYNDKIDIIKENLTKYTKLYVEQIRSDARARPDLTGNEGPSGKTGGRGKTGNNAG